MGFTGQDRGTLTADGKHDDDGEEAAPPRRIGRRKVVMFPSGRTFLAECASTVETADGAADVAVMGMRAPAICSWICSWSSRMFGCCPTDTQTILAKVSRTSSSCTSAAAMVVLPTPPMPCAPILRFCCCGCCGGGCRLAPLEVRAMLLLEESLAESFALRIARPPRTR
mgnify:CR=1 FL=1